MPSQTLTEGYTGTVVNWYVPNHTPGTLRVTCRGADGQQGGTFPNGRGGYGGSVRGYLTVAPGTLLKLVVGDYGSNSSPPSFLAKGGFKVGGTGAGAYRGGCATEVWDASSTRIMVAGGGGGGAEGSLGGGGRGGDGGKGIASGESSAPYFYGGTTSAAGAAGTGSTGTSPTAGSGGDGGDGGTSSGLYSGGGGGGYYGGGGGGQVGGTPVGGGGGSSWCDTGLFSSVDDTGAANFTAGITIVWDGDPVWIPPTGGIYVDGAVHF